MTSIPLLPVAPTNKVSEVEVSLSTVIQLKVSSFKSATTDCRSFLSINASVNIYTSIVPIFGAIIPDPFAMPEIVISVPLKSNLILLPFGKVSVVIIALAASPILDTSTESTRLLRTVIIFSYSNNSPITPVDDEKIRWTGKSAMVESEPTISLTAFSPCRPVKAFALPEFIIIAAPLP